MWLIKEENYSKKISPYLRTKKLVIPKTINRQPWPAIIGNLFSGSVARSNYGINELFPLFFFALIGSSPLALRNAFGRFPPIESLLISLLSRLQRNCSLRHVPTNWRCIERFTFARVFSVRHAYYKNFAHGHVILLGSFL